MNQINQEALKLREQLIEEALQTGISKERLEKVFNNKNNISFINAMCQSIANIKSKVSE